MIERPNVPHIGLLVPAAAVALWQLLGWAGLLQYEFLPTPGAVLGALGELLRDGELVRDVTHTVGVAATAAAIAIPLGAVGGLIIGLVPRLGRWVTASIDVARAVPAVALVPAAVLTIGANVKTEGLLAVYPAGWHMVIATAGGVAAVHPRQYEVARMLRLSPAATITKIVVPAAAPAALAGVRLALITCLLVTIAVEMLLYPKGLGGGLIEAFNALAPERIWAYTMVCAIIGWALSALVRRIGAHLLHRTGVTVPSTVSQPPSPLRGLLPLLTAMVVCQLVAQPDSLILPPPDRWLMAVSRLHSEGTLLPAVGQTLATYLLGLTSGVVLGVAVGAAVGLSRRVDLALSPTVDFLAAVPGAALLPAAVLLLGPNLWAGAAVVGVIVAWPLVLQVAASARTIPAVRLDMSRTVGLSPVRRWVGVTAPSLIPGALLGLRLATALGLIVTLLVDVFGTGTGIGRLLMISQQTFDAAAAWGLLLIVGVTGYLMSLASGWLARRWGNPVPRSAQIGAGTNGGGS